MAEAKRFGEPVVGWTPPPAPSGAVLEGHYVRLEPMQADLHAADLYRAYSGQDALWDYMPYGP
ncbi:MAG: GNAT family N-acetyltransferase, partial [Cypionkella sp.]